MEMKRAKYDHNTEALRNENLKLHQQLHDSKKGTEVELQRVQAECDVRLAQINRLADLEALEIQSKREMMQFVMETNRMLQGQGQQPMSMQSLQNLINSLLPSGYKQPSAAIQSVSSVGLTNPDPVLQTLASPSDEIAHQTSDYFFPRETVSLHADPSSSTALPGNPADLFNGGTQTSDYNAFNEGSSGMPR